MDGKAKTYEPLGKSDGDKVNVSMLKEGCKIIRNMVSFSNIKDPKCGILIVSSGRTKLKAKGELMTELVLVLDLDLDC